MSSGKLKRGVLYMVWGDSINPQLERSMASVKRFYPDMPTHVVRGDAADGLMQKSRMASLTPFESTLYLDADTIVMGNLDFAFERAEQFGLACCICECPWLRRYGPELGDSTEYNTGVLFFSAAAQEVFATWQRIAPTTLSRSRWFASDGQLLGLAYDDQSSFAQAVLAAGFNPHVLPLNWNMRPEFHNLAFAPIKIWHDRSDPPPRLEDINGDCGSGKRFVTLMNFTRRRS